MVGNLHTKACALFHSSIHQSVCLDTINIVFRTDKISSFFTSLASVVLPVMSLAETFILTLIPLSLPVAHFFFALLVSFTFSPFLGHGCKLQWASCTDRLSRDLLENTAQEQKCKQVEHFFVEFQFPVPPHTHTQHSSILHLCGCCRDFVGQNFLKAPYCACAPPLTISQASRDARHPYSVLGIL